MAGWILELWLGVVGAYLPLFIGVAAITWIGGLWPSLFSQLLGTALTLFFRTHGFAALSKADAYAAFLFLVAAKLTMFLLLNLRANRSLRENRTHLEAMLQSTHDALWEWDLGANYVWRGGKEVESFGCATGDTQQGFNWWLKRVHPSDAEEVWASLRRAIDGADSHWSREYRLRRHDGSYAIVSDHGFILRDKQGTALRMFGGMADVSAQRTAEERFAQGAVRDPLTGLLNRESLLNQFHRLLEKRRYRNEGPIAVLLIDIDYFRSTVEHFGHSTGNQLLNAVAVRLARCLRGKDIAARFGDDEFLVLLEDVETSLEAVHIIQRIQHSLSAPFEIDGQAMEVTASVGVSFAESVPAEQAIRQADLAMHRAKAQGRARFHVFEPASRTPLRHTLRYEDELRRGFHDGSLQLYYQPIVGLQDGRTFGVEALLRWQHPQRGLIQPLEVLRLAEEAGLTTQLGQWVLRNCCLCLDRWRQSSRVSPSLLMSLNLSGKELMRPTLLDEVRELLSGTNLGSNSLQIELTEAAVMESDAASAKKLDRLREMSVRVALDDFGKEYSFLSRLQQFPISAIKLDGLFTRKADTDQPQILDALMAFAQKLNLQVIAKEVETGSQLRYLEECGSALAQGFLFSEPVAEEKAFQLLSNQHSWNIAALTGEIGAPVSRETRIW
jgi:diguanylate cyclase (GGDEF)-like protein/PAS domain S-box-containing protein